LGWSAIEHYGWGSLAPGKSGLPRYFVNFIKRNGLSKPTVLSDSFETLRAAAAAGTIVSVLPHRVAKRLNDLVELQYKDSHSRSNPDAGKHRIVVASQLNCNREETDFLALETQRVLNSRNL
jgi:DNA-binding transcriptional LysR family regulator